MRLVPDKVRSISEEEVRTLKGAAAAAYHLAGGTAVAALRCRASDSQLSKYASFGAENQKTLIALDIAVEIDRAADSPVILSAYARLLGFELVPAEADEDEGEGEIDDRDAHRVARKAMALAEEIFVAREDGSIDALERRTITAKCQRLIRCVTGVMRRVGGH